MVIDLSLSRSLIILFTIRTTRLHFNCYWKETDWRTFLQWDTKARTVMATWNLKTFIFFLLPLLPLQLSDKIIPYQKEIQSLSKYFCCNIIPFIFILCSKSVLSKDLINMNSSFQKISFLITLCVLIIYILGIIS